MPSPRTPSPRRKAPNHPPARSAPPARPVPPAPPVHPGEILREEFCKPLGINGTVLANGTGMPLDRAVRLLKGTRAFTGDTALRLSRFFGTSAAFWMNLQARYDLDVAEAKLGREIAKQVRPFRAA